MNRISIFIRYQAFTPLGAIIITHGKQKINDENKCFLIWLTFLLNFIKQVSKNVNSDCYQSYQKS